MGFRILNIEFDTDGTITRMTITANGKTAIITAENIKGETTYTQQEKALENAEKEVENGTQKKDYIPKGLVFKITNAKSLAQLEKIRNENPTEKDKQSFKFYWEKRMHELMK